MFVGQDLDGVLPSSAAKLPYLKQLYELVRFVYFPPQTFYTLFILIVSFLLVYSNLGQNYLSGSIPPEWASTKLELL